MNKIFNRNIACVTLVFVLTIFLNETSAGTSAGDYDYSHRKRDCEITLLTPGNVPLAGALISVRLLKNDFAFGGTIRNEGFDALGDDYGEWFLKYFDVATPEYEMKWEYVMKCAKKCDPDFSKADSLLAWLSEKKITVRGHNLFSNEKEDRIPEWTRNLGATAFKQAMQERIDATMDHFKGKVDLWDLISEICHGEDGSFLSNSMLETRSGDANILSWILDEARKRDSSANFIINDYAIITSNDQTAADQFINKLKPLSSNFQIVGAKGHFGASMNKSSWEPNINYLAQHIEKPIWLTDVDFSIDVDQAPDKIEELMRTCFANPSVGGLTIGNWCEHFLQRRDFTSYFVDTLNDETPVGERWCEVRNEWKTDTGGLADESGKFKFTGYHGKYLVHISCYIDSFYLEPGEGTKSITVDYKSDVVIDQNPAKQKTVEFTINRKTVPIRHPGNFNRQMFLSSWSLSGQLLSRIPLNQAGGKYLVPAKSSSCRVFRIETADRLPLYTGKIMPIR